MTKTRKEFDSLGSIDVPHDKLWAAQTERSRNNFKIGHPGSMPIEVIYAFALLKKSIAHANCDLGILSKRKRDLISRVCDEIQSGKLDSHFPLVVWQTGSGTQTNMNINEVINHFDGKDVIGEITIVIKGKDKSQNNREINKFELQKELNDLIKAGLSLSQASKYLAKKNGLKKSEVYNMI